jgi:hypothetical protein
MSMRPRGSRLEDPNDVRLPVGAEWHLPKCVKCEQVDGTGVQNARRREVTDEDRARHLARMAERDAWLNRKPRR